MMNRLILSATFLCSACAFGPQVNRATVDYNEAVANSANELTFLNILRAMERYPLHFTSISKINGSFKVTGRAGIGGTIAENGGSSKLSPDGSLVERSATVGAESFTPSLGTEIAAGPNFDIAILDTQDFYQGILRSLDPATVANFINLGWPDDLIAAVLIERIEFHVPKEASGPPNRFDDMRPRRYGPPEAIWTLNNDPGNIHFGSFLRCFRLRPNATTPPPTPLFPLSQVEKPKLSDLLLFDGEKLSLSGKIIDTSRVVQRVKPTTKGLSLGEVRKEGADCSFELLPEDPRHQPRMLSMDLYYPETQGRGQPEALLDQEHSEAGETVVELTGPGQQELSGARDEVKASVHIVLRSAQSVIYYLGEYARASLNDDRRYTLRNGQDVIAVRRGREAGAFLRARLNGVTYSVPGDPEQHGRTPTVIDLAQQLFNLQKSAKDKPTTETVRLIE
jgi:hypothetical protein